MKLVPLKRNVETMFKWEHSVPVFVKPIEIVGKTLDEAAHRLKSILGRGKVIVDERGVKCIQHDDASYNTRYYILGTEPRGKAAKVKF